ncbi:MAG: glycosyltransferase family 4 protein [Patescibacteria group bacterium]
MPKVLLPSSDYPPARGGVARYIQAILQTYPEQVTLLPLKRLKLDNLVLTLLFKAKDYEAIWTHHVLPVGTAVWILNKLTGKPYVIFLHGLDFDLARRNPWKQALTRRVLVSASRVVTNSQALATEVRDFVELKREPLVIYPTLEDKFIAASKHKATTGKVNLQKLGELALGVARASTPMFVSDPSKSQTTLRLLTVGRLVERKGHLKVLRALAAFPAATYQIVGDGPMREQIEAEIETLNLQDRVVLNTNVTDDELPDIYRAADIFVMPTSKTETDREGFGIVYLEAQLFGLPVIATKQPGVDEAVKDGEGGLLIGDTPAELETAIRRLLDAAVRSKFKHRARVWAEREFSRDQQMYKLRELL